MNLFCPFLLRKEEDGTYHSVWLCKFRVEIQQTMTLQKIIRDNELYIKNYMGSHLSSATSTMDNKLVKDAVSNNAGVGSIRNAYFSTVYKVGLLNAPMRNK